MNTSSDNSAMTRFPAPELESLPKDIQDQIITVQEKSGFVPNVFLALAHRPDEFRAFFAYYNAVMNNGGNLSQADREMIIVATSAINNCIYCVVAHGAVLRIRKKDAFIADQVATNYHKADITPRERAMLDFATKVCNASHCIDTSDYEALYPHGFDDEDIWTIAAITAFFGLSNRMANTVGMRPNNEFFALGR